MSDIPTIAATAWAQAHASRSFNPVEFGNKVAQVYLACRNTVYQTGDEKATAASLAALSIPLEVLQRLEQVSSLLSRPVGLAAAQTDSAGA